MAITNASEKTATLQAASGYMATLVRHIVSALVDDALSVAVNVTMGSDTKGVLTILVAPEDLGRIIGKQGRTAKSLRTIIGGAARKYNVTFDVVIDMERGFAVVSHSGS